MSSNKPEGLNLVNLALVGVVCYALYSFSAGGGVTPDPTGLDHPAAKVYPRLVMYSAAAYKEALEGLTDTSTEADFNESLRKLQGNATSLAYAPLDEFLQSSFSSPDGEKKSSWSPSKARAIYTRTQEALQGLSDKMLKAGLAPVQPN